MEFVAAVALGNVGLDSLQSLLATIGALCGEMQDAQGACARVHERLADILDELRRVPRLPTQDKLVKYAQLLHRYLTFLRRYREKPLVWRLLKHASMMDELKTLHEEIDTLVVLLQLSTASMLGEWRQQWDTDSEAQMRVLLALVDNSASVLHEVRDARAQVEALTTLKFEFEQRQSEQTDQMMGMLKKLYTQIVRVSSVQVPSIPPWFLPSSDVEYDATPFAQGSFGAVHHARWNSGARVVVKTLLVDNLATQSGSRSAQSRILAEIDVWFRLNHPNVIKMYGACHVSSPPFIVCELAAHGNLADFLDKSSEHQQLMWQLLYEAALGLEYLHKRKVVHGDLKLNNILVGSDAVARLADFGLSSVRSTSATSTATASRRATDGGKTEQTAGALRWRAPECLKGKPKFASDVYSLGMCIIEAATGEPPFATVADDIVFQLLRHGEIPDQPDDLDDDAWALVVAMTKLEPSERCPLEFAIASLKRFAQESSGVENKSLFATNSTSSMAMTSSLSSSFSSSSEPAVSVTRSSGTSSWKGSTSADTEYSSLPTMNLLSLESPHARRGSSNDTTGIDETSSVAELLVAVQSDAPARRKLALQWIFRSTYDAHARADLVASGAIEILRRVVENASVGYYQQLYAFGCVDELTKRAASESMPKLLPRMRDATVSDLSGLLRTLSAAYPDDERIEATEVLTLLAHIQPNVHVLAESASQFVDLLRSRSALLSSSAALGLAAWCRNESVETETAMAFQRRATTRLVEMIRTGTRREVAAAVRAIGAFAKKCQSSDNRVVAEAGGVAPLVALLKSASDDLRLTVVEILADLARDCEQVQRAMIEAGAVVSLVELLADQQDETSVHAPAARALGYLAKDNAQHQTSIAQSGAIGPLLELVQNGDPGTKEAAVVALAHLAKDNETNALRMASLGALDTIATCLRDALSLSLQQATLAALAHISAPYENATSLTKVDVNKSIIAQLLQANVDNDTKVFARQILDRIAAAERAATTPPPVETEVAFDGVLDARTTVTDLLRVVRTTATVGGDRLKTALRWLYRHAYDFKLCAAIQDSDGATALLEVALHDGSAYGHRLYAFGCLAQLSLESATMQLAKDHLREPTYADVQRLYVAMAPTATDDARAEAIELFACLQSARASDHGLSEFLPRLMDGLRSMGSSRLVGAAARAIAAVARQLPASGPLLVDRGALELLIHLVQRGDPFPKETAAEALGAIATISPVLQYQVMNAGAIAPLTALVANGERQHKMRAVLALSELLRDNEVVQIMATNAGVVNPLMELMRSRDETEASYGALGILSVCQKGGLGAYDVVARGAVQPLLDLLRWATNEATQLRAAQALYALSASPSAVAQLRSLGVREAMLQLTHSATSAELRIVAQQTVQNLA